MFGTYFIKLIKKDRIRSDLQQHKIILETEKNTNNCIGVFKQF